MVAHKRKKTILFETLAAVCLSCVSFAQMSPGHTEKPFVAPFPVPDTGQTTCYNNNSEIPCPLPNQPFYGQDANYSINKPLTIEKNIAGTEVVVDTVTGLGWQAAPDNRERTWRQAVDYGEGLRQQAGPIAWRLPTKQELQSIFRYGISRDFPINLPPTDKSPYPSTDNNNCLWSLTTRKFPSLFAMAVCPADNNVIIRNKYEKKLVLPVFGPLVQYGKFIDNNNGTVTDTNTGLMWQVAETRAATWQQALLYCCNLTIAGFNDWRLPNIRELLTIVNDNRTNPSINTKLFPGCRPEPYWSSTTNPRHPSFAWIVNFKNGFEKDGGYKGRRYFVRAIRGGNIIIPTYSSPAGRVRPHEKNRSGKVEEEVHLLNKIPAPKEELDRLEPYPLDLENTEYGKQKRK